MTEQPDLFSVESHARTTDPETSHDAARRPFRRGSQRHRLLVQFSITPLFAGMTDEEAARSARIFSGCPWKRCSELRELGYIEPTTFTRVSTMGATQRICRITPAGREIVERIERAPR